MRYRQQISENPYEFGKETMDFLNSTQSMGLRMSTTTEKFTGRNHLIRTSEDANRQTIYEQDLQLPRIKTGNQDRGFRNKPMTQSMRSSE